MNRLFVGLILFIPVVLNAATSGTHLIAWADFRKFTCSTNVAGEIEWLSPKTQCPAADEFIPSWNAELEPDGYLRVEIRAFRDGKPTKFYDLGHWSRDAVLHPRESIKGQEDADGDVNTDTLQLRAPAEAIQFKLTLGTITNAAKFKLLTLAATDTKATLKPRNALRSIWGKAPIPVPQRSQMIYPDGATKWCSPTTTSMLLAFWSEKLNRPDLNFAVPDVAQNIHDTTWNGTGNWAFNMAFAGAQPGMRAFVSRFNDVRELEGWIASGRPVGISVCYDRLRGKGREPNGHLMICVGFDRNGDVILNDPGRLVETRGIFPRERFVDAWAYSRNTVYLIFPESEKLPRDEFGHWTLGRAN